MTFDCNQLANQKKHHCPLWIYLHPYCCSLPSTVYRLLLTLKLGPMKPALILALVTQATQSTSLAFLLLSYAQASYDVVRTGATSSHMDPSH
jgi:hypothetical protein